MLKYVLDGLDPTSQRERALEIEIEMLREVIVELKQENYALQKANERWRRLFNKPETALGDTSLLLD